MELVTPPFGAREAVVGRAVYSSRAMDEHKLTRELKRAAFITSDDHALTAPSSANMRLTDIRLVS